jgi:hypothetical protein
MAVANRATVILIVRIGLTTTTTTIPFIHTTTVAIIPCIPITDIPLHIIHTMDTTPIMGVMGIALIDIATQRHAPRLVI